MAKILCIDDDMDIRETIRLIVEEEGHTFEEADSGAAGFEFAQTLKPDIILVDVMMEDSTAGFHTVYQFRQDADLKHKPILMLTSINETVSKKFNPEKDGKFLPVDDFQDKPVIRDKLIASINRLLKLTPSQINVEGKS